MSKSILQIIYTSCLQKTPRKNSKYSRTETILKIGHHANGIANKKSLLWVKNQNSVKHLKIYFKNHLQLFCAKKLLKKNTIFEKWEHFENRPSCKGYSTCKILTLSQKLKFKKTCKNPFYKSLTLVCKKTARKNTKYSRNETILKTGHQTEAIANAKSPFWVRY